MSVCKIFTVETVRWKIIVASSTGRKSWIESYLKLFKHFMIIITIIIICWVLATVLCGQALISLISLSPHNSPSL